MNSDFKSDFKAAIAVIATSAFWLIVLIAISSGYDINAYRQGYAEGKAGMPQRWERSVGGMETN